MRRPRISTRVLMVAVLGFGLFLGLGLPAAEVYRSDECHPHAFIDPSGKGIRGFVDVDENVNSPFWPRYLRRISGKPWKHQQICGGSRGRLEEICEFEHPDNFMTTCSGPSFHLVFPSEVMDRKIESIARPPIPSRSKVGQGTACPAVASVHEILDESDVTAAAGSNGVRH